MMETNTCRNYDIIIVGTGAAGLFTALSLPKNLQILLITKDSVENSDSYLAQGGICVLKSPNDYASYFEDTMRAGHYENNPESVKVMIEESPHIIEKLISFGVEFEHNGSELAYTKEGAHSTCRILYHKDITGKEITSRLIQKAKQYANIQMLAHTTMVDLLSVNNTCKGILARERDGHVHPFYAKAVFLATGGIGGLFTQSTNYRHITGDSFSIALKHNVELEHLNYIQFHPTTLYSPKEGRRFLISESARGEGAVLLTPSGKRFVNELLPRDVVANAIREEMAQYQSPFVYLSMSHLPKEHIQNRFPNIYERCLEEGYDLVTDMIPITPAQHYLMGGIKTDTHARTSMKHLFAVGEAGCNGVHGANRLASNSLLESLVFAERGAHALASDIHNIPLETIPLNMELGKYSSEAFIRQESKEIIFNELKRRDEEFYDKWCNSGN